METKPLTERQEKILALVIREYTNKSDRPEPISSKLLAENYLTSLSSATIRNELAILEELGYLAAPHTSAGRIPTEAGYRYFVRQLLDDSDLAPEEQELIASEFSQAPSSVEQWLHVAASTLARTSRSAALITAPRAISSQFKHLELISTQGRLVLMVLVLHGGDVRQRMLTLTDTVSQEQLSAVARQLNSLCDGQTAEQIRGRLRGVDNELHREVLEIVAEILSERDNSGDIITYREGLSDLMSESAETQGIQQALRVLEERTLLRGILSEALDQHVGHVRVLIAGEGRWNEVTHLSIVLSRYGVTGQVTGTLGVLGPTRMRYGRAISTVRYVAALMSNLLFDAYGLESGETGESSGI